ncbi:MAG: hypothetical protein ACKOWL_06495 [Sphingobacteriaceae bacterium]
MNKKIENCIAKMIRYYEAGSYKNALDISDKVAEEFNINSIIDASTPIILGSDTYILIKQLADFHAIRGACYRKLHTLNKALSEYQKAARGAVQAHLTILEIQEEQKHYKKVISLAKELKKKFANYYDVDFLHGVQLILCRALLLLGEEKLAQHELDILLQEVPRDSKKKDYITNNLAQLRTDLAK